VETVEAGEMVFRGAAGITASADAQRIYRNEELYELHEKLRALEKVQQAVETLSPPPPLPLQPRRGLDDERDEVARQILRELGWGQQPRPGEFWKLPMEQVKQLWRMSGKFASRCPAQDKYTSYDQRRKALRAAFRRITGS
jgi:hypothetical protein